MNPGATLGPTVTLHKRPQLTPDEVRQLRWLLGGLLTLLGVWTVFYMDIDAWVLMGLTTVVATATVLKPTLPSRVPRLTHTLAFPVIVVFFTIDLWLKGEVLPAMVRLDILLLLYRSISYRQRRDDLQIIVLGLFLIVVAGVLTVSLLFAAQLLVYTACALAFLFVVTLSETGSATGSTKPDFGAGPPAWALHVDWPPLLRRLRAAADWRVIGFGSILFVGVVAVSALLFLAIPRFQLQNSMFLDRFITKKAKSGFSETVRFGDVTDLQQDDSVALSVDVDPKQIPATPYWRMLVLDSYEKETFRLSLAAQPRVPSPMPAWVLQGGSVEVREADAPWIFYLEAGVSRYLPLLGRFGRIEFNEVQNFRYAKQLSLVALREEPVTMLGYRVRNFDFSPSLHDPDFAKDLRAVRELPPPQPGKEPSNSPARNRTALLRSLAMLDPASRALLAAAQREAVGEGSLTAIKFTERVNEWLKRTHSYSLSPRIPAGDEDPLVKWLARGQVGHCELFAGSFVLLARSAGFYARVVTGFKGGTWNGYSGNFTIRNADAHAWAEIYDEVSESWLRADPLGVSAGVQAEQEPKGAAAIAARTDRSWSARLDSLRVFWYRRIVSFDQQSQLETLKSMKEATQNSGKQLRAALETAVAAIKEWLTSPWDVRRFGGLLAGVAGVALGVWLWRGWGRAWWRMLRRRGSRQGDDPVRREAGEWLVRLAAAESPLPPGEPVIRDLQRLRFGARETWEKPDAVFHAARRARREQRRVARATQT